MFAEWSCVVGVSAITGIDGIRLNNDSDTPEEACMVVPS